MPGKVLRIAAECIPKVIDFEDIFTFTGSGAVERVLKALRILPTGERFPVISLFKS
jgi:hypothetical protein